MIFRLLITKSCHQPSYIGGSRIYKQVMHYCQNESNLKIMCKYLKISENEAEFLRLKHRGIRRLNGEELKNLIQVVNELGFKNKVLVEEPALCSLLPITLRYRYKVLNECGVQTVSAKHLVSYLPIVKQKTIGELRKRGVISPFINIENKLANYMTQWPTSLTTMIYGNVDDLTLQTLRLKIIQRYLELVLDLTEVEFLRGIKTYPNIKHRPLEVINATLNILQTQVLMTAERIKSHFYLIHADPENLKNILYKFRYIGGIDIKEILRMYPKLAIKSYTTLMEMQKVLEEYGISNEAQIRCFQIYTLGPETVRERLEKAKSIPEFSTFSKHPRFLKMIHYNNTAMKRLRNLYTMNKKCLSLNILSGSTAHYEVFEKAPGDRFGKGKDLIFCIHACLGNAHSMADIRKKLKRHPFWINIPLVQITYVYEKLSREFSPNDIYENCPILFYPWNKIKEVITLSNKNYENNLALHLETINFQKLSKSQQLSLALYLLEKNHYFTGNGVWNDEKNKITDNVANKSALMQ